MPSFSDEIVAEIIEKWSAGFRRLDAQAIASLYSDSVFFFGSKSQLYRGRNGVAAYFNSLPRWSSPAVRFDVVTAQVSADVINVAGHRLGTREIEEAVQAHSGIAEVAVVGMADALKGQVPVAFAVVKDPARVADAAGIAQMRKEVMDTVDRELGAIARPGAVYFVTLLPKTRSGKLLRRSLQALAEGRDPGDLTTIEDPAALEQIRMALAARV